MKKIGFVLLSSLVLSVLLSSGIAQKTEKPWTEWTKQEVQKTLESSPWAQVQNDTNTDQMMFSPTSDPRLTTDRGSTGSVNLPQGATNQSVNVKFLVRFFSARPIRQALARQLLLAQKQPADAVPAGLRQFAEMKSENSIIVTVTYDSTDQRSGNKVLQAFSSATTASLKNNTYLQRTDGKQLFLEEYIPPGKDGFGARFIFLRYPDEKAFVDEKTAELRFFAQFSNDLKVDRRFKLADMKFQGELEY